MRKAKLKLSTVAITLGVILLLVLATVTSGCDKKSSSGKSVKTIQEGTTVRFDGYVQGCEQNYDPIFCADKYNPNSLNAGEDVNTTNAQYEDNTSIILIREGTSDE